MPTAQHLTPSARIARLGAAHDAWWYAVESLPANVAEWDSWNEYGKNYGYAEPARPSAVEMAALRYEKHLFAEMQGAYETLLAEGLIDRGFFHFDAD